MLLSNYHFIIIKTVLQNHFNMNVNVVSETLNCCIARLYVVVILTDAF